jgi:hypothetical protein
LVGQGPERESGAAKRAPVGQVLAGGQDHRAELVEGIHGLEEVVEAPLLHGQVAELVDDQQAYIRIREAGLPEVVTMTNAGALAGI